MLYPDKNLFIDSVTIGMETTADDWGRKTYTDYQLNNVRFVRKNIYSGTGSAQLLLGTGTVYILPIYTIIPDGLTINDKLLNAKLTYSEHDYKIVNIAFHKDLYDHDMYSYEIGVM